MTDKEWEGMKNWIINKFNPQAPIETTFRLCLSKFNNTWLIITKAGLILFDYDDICKPVRFALAENRTPAQMKAIIENLL